MNYCYLFILGKFIIKNHIKISTSDGRRVDIKMEMLVDDVYLDRETRYERSRMKIRTQSEQTQRLEIGIFIGKSSRAYESI